jgi:Protein of unknown function (DUF1168)
MSEAIPESIPTSRASTGERRPTKRTKVTEASLQAKTLEALFKNPDKEIHIPSSELAHSNRAVPEIVANVQGSSAGAGSGEFHVYKASRRREYERIKAMEDEVRKETETEEFERKREEIRLKDEEKVAKNRAKRDKRKKKGGKDKVVDGKEKAGDNGTVHRGGEGDEGAELLKGDKKDDVEGREDHANVKSSEVVGLIIHDDD